MKKVVVAIMYEGPGSGQQPSAQHYYRAGIGGSVGGPNCLPLRVLGKLPEANYRVEWRLAPYGAYKVVEIGRVRRRGRPGQATICFLPAAWVGRRVTRRILPW